MPYSAPEYWQELHRRNDLSAVGQSGLPALINEWLYRTLARNFRTFIRRHHLDRPVPARVFDVGSGTGFWVRFWLDRGATTVDGCDLIPEAVERLSERFGSAGCRFSVEDVSDPAGIGSERYDLVSCPNVLLHVTDDDQFRQALANVAALVAPGGALVLVDPILLHDEFLRPATPEQQSRARPLAAYQEPLEAAGLRLEALEAATAVANNPIEAGSLAAMRRYQAWWRFVARRSKANPRSAAWLGPILYVVDLLALRLGAAPTSKFALFRRPRAERGSYGERPAG